MNKSYQAIYIYTYKERDVCLVFTSVYSPIVSKLLMTISEITKDEMNTFTSCLGVTILIQCGEINALSCDFAPSKFPLCM